VTWLDRSAILSFEEIEALARGALDLGIDKLRLTGGEPLVRRGIVKLVAMLGRIQGIKDFAMTTNGVLLADFAADLRLAGLGRLNISLDTLDPDRFREISRGGDLSRVLAGIDAAWSSHRARKRMRSRLLRLAASAVSMSVSSGGWTCRKGTSGRSTEGRGDTAIAAIDCG
jgi:cyclic pyranopterin phosphate synthase